MKRYLLLFLSFVFLVLSQNILAQGWNADNLPMVHLNNSHRYVCDPDGLMTISLRDSADLYLYRLEKEAKIQTVFKVVNLVENGDVFRIAQDIGNRNGVGDSKTNKGLVVVISVNDHRYFIATGSGLEGDLTDVESDDIAQACIVKNMRLGNVDNAVLETTKALYKKFTTGESGIESDTEEGNVKMIIIFVIIGIIAFLSYLGRNGKGGGFGGPIIFGNPGHFNDDSSGFSGGSFGGGGFSGGGAGGGW